MSIHRLSARKHLDLTATNSPGHDLGSVHTKRRTSSLEDFILTQTWGSNRMRGSMDDWIDSVDKIPPKGIMQGKSGKNYSSGRSFNLFA